MTVDVWNRYRAGTLSSPDELVGDTSTVAVAILDSWRWSNNVDTRKTADRMLRDVLRIGPFASAHALTTAVDRYTIETSGMPWNAFFENEFGRRRLLDMVFRNRIRINDFQDVYQNPRSLGVLWGIYRADQLTQTFRVDEESQLVSVDDEPVVAQSFERIGVAHPLEMGKDERSRWQELFADYELSADEQLNRAIEFQDLVEVNEFGIWVHVAADPSCVSQLGFLTDSTETHSLAFVCGHGTIDARVQIYESSAHVTFSKKTLALPIREVDQVVIFETLYAVQRSSDWENTFDD